MKIKTLKDMGFEGKHTPAGAILEVKETLARELIGGGRAIAVEADEVDAVVEADGPAPFPGDDTLEGTQPEGDEPDDAPAPKPSRAKK
jgi:hypothetical protein